MPETEQRETELVVGAIGGITQKKTDTWTVAVTPDGSEYAKNLWTKDSALVGALADKIGQYGTFVCKASLWERDGKQVRSLWIQESGPDGETVSNVSISPPGSVPASGEEPSQTPPPGVYERAGSKVDTRFDGMTPEKWDAKERRDYRSRAWAQTLAAFQHTIKVDEDPVAVFERLQPFQRKVYVDVTGMFAFPADESDVPF